MMSIEKAQNELYEINCRTEQLQEALLAYIEKPCYPAEVLLEAIMKESREYGRILAKAGYVSDEDLLADYMSLQKEKA
jgi:hypothetical protein